MCINFNFCVRVIFFRLDFFSTRRRRAFFFRQRDYGNNLWATGCVLVFVYVYEERREIKLHKRNAQT